MPMIMLENKNPLFCYKQENYPTEHYTLSRGQSTHVAQQVDLNFPEFEKTRSTRLIMRAGVPIDSSRGCKNFLRKQPQALFYEKIMWL